MKDLSQLRQEIDAIDRQLVALFEQRMAVTQQVGKYKLAQGLPVLDRNREEQVLAEKAALLQDKNLTADVTDLFEAIMAISRRQQQKLLDEHSK
jgi:chorismate mutase/prephenate dehydratase